MSEIATMRTEIRDALSETLDANPETLVLGEDIREYGGAFAVTGDLWRRFPDREQMAFLPRRGSCRTSCRLQCRRG